jgi:tetratricopeptide (TPR) repeat protein
MVAAGNPEHRQVGVVGLLRTSDAAEDLEQVRARLQDVDSGVRWTAALALGQSGHVEAIPWLRDVVEKDQIDSVREVAGEAADRLARGIRWLYSLPEGLRQAAALKKPVVLYVFIRGSTHCEQFEGGSLADREVVDALQEFVCVRLDGLAAEAEVKRYTVRGAPTVLLLNGEGHEISRVAGMVGSDALLRSLSEVRRGKQSFREALQAAGQDAKNVTANWQVARTYLDEGREDLAEAYLWNVVSNDDANRYGYTDDALFALGFVHGKQGRHANAVTALEKLLERWPVYRDKDRALYCLALSRLALGRKDAARSGLEQLIAEFPSSAVVGNAKKVLERME